MKNLLLLAFFLPVLFAQDNRPDTQSLYVTTRESSLSSTAEKITVQQPTSNAKIVIFKYAKVYCSVACVATLSVNGTAASTTALTPTPLNQSPAAKALGFRSSNAGSGTTLDSYRVGAGQELGIDLSSLWMDADGTAYNLSIGTDSMSGTARITIAHLEK